MLDFPIAGHSNPVVTVHVGHIIGLVRDSQGKVTLRTSDGESYPLVESYDDARAKIRNATGPRGPAL